MPMEFLCLSCPAEQELRALQRELCARNKQLSRWRQDVARWGLTPRGQRVCLAVWILSKYDTDLAVVYAKHARQQRRRKFAEERFPIVPPIQEWFLEMNLDEIADILDSDKPCLLSIREDASRFIAEHQCVAWIGTENFARGRAPDAASVAAEYNRLCASLGLASRHVLVEAHAGRQVSLNRSGRKFVARFRKRWRVTKGCTLPSEPMTRAEAQDKALAPCIGTCG